MAHQIIIYKKLRRYSFRNPSANLDDLLLYARRLDETERQARGIEGANATTSAEYKVHKVSSNQIKPPTSRRQSIPRRPQHLKDTKNHKTCFRCGNPWPHQDNSCPAIDQQCKKCLKMNHFARVCKSNRDTRQLAKHSGIHNVIPDSQPDNPIPDSDSDSEPSVYTVSNTTTFGAEQPKTSSKPYSKNKKRNNTNFRANVSLGKSTVKFLIDCGSSENIIDAPTFIKVLKQNPEIQLRKSKKRLFAFGSSTPCQSWANLTLPLSHRPKLHLERLLL